MNIAVKLTIVELVDLGLVDGSYQALCKLSDGEEIIIKVDKDLCDLYEYPADFRLKELGRALSCFGVTQNDIDEFVQKILVDLG